jgi:hypothetical protein
VGREYIKGFSPLRAVLTVSLCRHPRLELGFAVAYGDPSACAKASTDGNAIVTDARSGLCRSLRSKDALSRGHSN